MVRINIEYIIIHHGSGGLLLQRLRHVGEIPGADADATRVETFIRSDRGRGSFKGLKIRVKISSKESKRHLNTQKMNLVN